MSGDLETEGDALLQQCMDSLFVQGGSWAAEHFDVLTCEVLDSSRAPLARYKVSDTMLDI